MLSNEEIKSSIDSCYLHAYVYMHINVHAHIAAFYVSLFSNVSGSEYIRE